MTEYNAQMQKVMNRFPARMRALPVMEGGWPKLWFAGITQEGKQDLRTADPAKRVLAVRKSRCWLCGQPLGVYKVFVIGPMCSVTRTTLEPPCHHECAEFAAVACPFLTRPKMRRNDADLPEGYQAPPGIGIMRNPGVTCLWVCRKFKTFRTGKSNGEWLIHLGQPSGVHWYAEGRTATRAEILESVDTGYPLLLAEAWKDGQKAVNELIDMRNVIDGLLPAAVDV